MMKNNIVSARSGIKLQSPETLKFEAILNSNLFPCIYLGLLVLIAHGNAITFGFAREDIGLLKNLSEWDFWCKVFGYWRPVWCLWLSIQYTLFGLNPHAMHVASLILYALNGWLAFNLMTVIGIKKSVAIAAVSLWILMAGNVYASVWISECNDLLAMFFLLLASLIWILYCLKNKPSIVFVCLACICWLLSIMTKEVGMLWPIGAVAVTFLRAGHSEKKIYRSWKFYSIMTLPIVFMIFYVCLKILAQGPSAGLNLYEYANHEGMVINCPLTLKFLKMTIHYIEGVFYSFLPLELFLSWTGLIWGTLVCFCLILCLTTRNKGLFRSNILPLSGGMLWILIFSIHTSFNTSVRTEYIATLGTAFIICFLFFSTNTKKFFNTTLVFLSFYIGMHIFLGMQVAEYFSPSSPDIISCNARFINSSKITEEKKDYLRNNLWYVDIDLMTNYENRMFVDKGPWKNAKKAIFQHVIIQRFENSHVK
jgi:hypothetical protein